MKKPQKSLKNWTDEKTGAPSPVSHLLKALRLLVKDTYPRRPEKPSPPKSMQQPQLRNVQTLKRVSSFPLNQRKLQQRLKGTDHDRETTNLS
jgi:hypothetical protein